MKEETMKKHLILALLISSSLLADSIPVSQIMTPQEQRSIGLDRMSPDQKRAFEQWAASYTQSVINQAPSYRPGQNLSSWIQSWPSFANPTKTEYSPEEIQQKQESNQIIDRILNNGEWIELRNGSKWHVSPTFRYLSRNWLRDQNVLVQRGTNPKHPWLVNNISVGQAVEADLGTAPSATGTKAQKPESYYEGSVPVANVTEQGDLLSLADGTLWKIAPRDIYKAKNWKPSDRVKVEKSGDFLYKYRLTNLDSGQTALANPRR